jgi:hypothetical protein
MATTTVHSTARTAADARIARVDLLAPARVFLQL